MLLIRCTRKLQQEMGLKTRDIAEPIVVPAEPLAEWYADLVRVGAKKIIVFTHASTLFTIVALDVHRPGIPNFAIGRCRKVEMIPFIVLTDSLVVFSPSSV